MSPLISIVITAYNQEHSLAAAIESILQQTYSNVELLVWDNGSTDQSVQIADQYALQDHRIKVVVAAHRGRRAVLQAAIAHTSGVYVGWLDSDDVLAPPALEQVIRVLNRCVPDEQSDAQLVFPDCINLDEQGNVLKDGQQYHFRLVHRSLVNQVCGTDWLQKQLNDGSTVKGRPFQAQSSLQTKPLSNSIATFAPRAPRVASLLVSLPLLGTMAHVLTDPLSTPARAQSISPAADGVNTVVTPNGNRYDIGGGTQSGNNLFQSFQKFGLSSGEIANFLANPQIQNILGRVTGGDPSVINGLIQVTGGNPNLFLMNPAGIVFGPNASLNVPASFTATTATGIGFGNAWFSAIGSNNYTLLTGSPSAFAFTVNQPGAIVNAGSLSVGSGNALNLVGGTVANTGQLNAPGGQVNVVAVPGSQLLRLTQPGSLLSFDITSPNAGTNLPNNWSISIASLPQLLTGGNLDSATGITLNPDGSIRLASSPQLSIPVNSGTAIASGSINVSGVTAGKVQVLGDRVGLVNANINASSNASGGTVLIGGGYQGAGAIPNASNTYVDGSSVISANSLLNGSGGQVVVWADQNTQFFGSINARGGVNSGNGGSVEVSGKNNLNYRGIVDASAPAGTPGTLLLDPIDITIVTGSGTGTSGFTGQVLFADPGPTTISENELEALDGTTNVVIQATNSITFQPFEDGILQFQTISSSTPGSIRFEAGGAITMNSTDIIRAQGRSVTLTAGSLSLGDIDTSTDLENGGNINLTSTIGSVTAGVLNSSATNGETAAAIGGSVTVNSAKDIVLDSINAEAFALAGTALGNATGGNVTLATNGSGVIRLTGVFTAANGEDASISTIGTINRTGIVDSGEITITHGGGINNVPFTVGNPSINGSAGEINAGGTSVLTAGQSFDVAQGGNSTTPVPGITINSINAPPTLTATSTLSGATQNTPFNISYADLVPNATDPNNDQTVIRILSIAPGSALTLNGNPVIPGVTTISPGDVLVYTPPTGATGSLEAFTIVSSDFQVVSSQILSNSDPISIRVSVASLPIDEPPIDEPPIDEPSITNPCVLTTCNTAIQQPAPGPISNVPLNPTTAEADFTREFEAYLGLPPVNIQNNGQQVAQEIERATGAKPAFIYVSFVPKVVNATGTLRIENQDQDDDELELVLVTAKGNPVRKRIPEAIRSIVLPLAQQFRNEVSDPRKTRATNYLTTSRQLYQWIIIPLLADLQERGITNLIFIMDAGLRSLPVAALHDGQKFLIEDYSVGLIPSLSLTDTRYQDIRGVQVLGMGISESTQNQPPLPAVPAEVSTIVKQLWPGQLLLNSQATVENIKSARQQQPFGIIHLATHADFQPGEVGNSYIQFWNEKLRLDQIRQLNLNNPQVELMVLSACATALGNRDAELGFGGLAVQAGVKTAIASLWYVSDAATTALMTGFYRNLRTAPIKAQALQQAQLAMARGQVFIENGRLKGLEPGEGIPLPPESLNIRDRQLSHPYYWAAFTMVGNPW